MLTSNWIPISDPKLLRRLGKTLEEFGESVAVFARCIIQGLDERDPSSGKINRQRMIEEVADVYAQLDETVFLLDLPRDVIRKRRMSKQAQMQEWESMNK